MDDTARRLDALMTFPVDFTFQVIAAAAPDLGARCATAAGLALGRAVAGVEERPSSRGRWVAIHVRAEVRSADEILAAYAALRAVEGVRMLL